MSMLQGNELFKDLFVLELANNHWGKVERGLKIIQDHGSVVRHNGVKAAIKLQFRDVDGFIHPDYKGDKANRYIAKTEATRMSREDYATLVKAIRNVSCIPMATPFDEPSVDLCVAFDMPIIKIASSDLNDWPLIEKIASTRLPVIVSTGGAGEKDLDDLVLYFEKRNIPLAINHCVSLYPSEPHQLELNQIDYLMARYPGHVIGLSTHEHLDWQASMHISYAKGARTWERHIDIDMDGVAVSPYCSLPEQVDCWFKAWHAARTMCGGSKDSKRVNSREEVCYLDALVRGVYARRDLPEGYVFSNETFARDFYLAIPLRKGQLSCREVINGETLVRGIRADEALGVAHVSGPYNASDSLRRFILERGL
ncbi:N-acetylneuraminate synthase family protein [uncultured Desulfovibrio sp.]|jgi:Sialic acid synthase|uniref:N-acetylneuraminate synthase family protein n=1 Tax=uncultured Desulfovibrio sp. TaxID=167968 RepID=UPI00261FBCD9|nr:N-acetylneuraminate synthase family protein [uncultured Desulfovibrio sp.]